MSDHFDTTWTWQVTNLSGAATNKAASWVRCSVEGQSGLEVRLAAVVPGEPGAPPAWSALTGSRPDFGPFGCELGPARAGYYTLDIDGLNAQLGLWLDGAASAVVRLVPAAGESGLATGPRLAHVLLLGQMMVDAANFLALTRYVAEFGAVVTFDPREAMRAEHVIVVGGPQLVGEAIEQQVRAAGAHVERVQGSIAGLLDRAVAAGTPYVGT